MKQKFTVVALDNRSRSKKKRKKLKVKFHIMIKKTKITQNSVSSWKNKNQELPGKSSQADDTFSIIEHKKKVEQIPLSLPMKITSL